MLISFFKVTFRWIIIYREKNLYKFVYEAGPKNNRAGVIASFTSGECSLLFWMYSRVNVPKHVLLRTVNVAHFFFLNLLSSAIVRSYRTTLLFEVLFYAQQSTNWASHYTHNYGTLKVASCTTTTLPHTLLCAFVVSTVDCDFPGAAFNRHGSARILIISEYKEETKRCGSGQRNSAGDNLKRLKKCSWLLSLRCAYTDSWRHSTYNVVRVQVQGVRGQENNTSHRSWMDVQYHFGYFLVLPHILSKIGLK